MNFSKQKMYTILLLLLVLFVSLSFSYIFKIPIIEGICLPSCENIKIDFTKDNGIPDCTPADLKLLQTKDAVMIAQKCLFPFIQKINDKMKTDYDYDTIYTLYDNKNELSSDDQSLIDMKKYFTDFSNNTTKQDVMDNLVLKWSSIQNNSIFQKNENKEKIKNAIEKYEKERGTEMKDTYDDLFKEITPYGDSILIYNECSNHVNKNYYKDETFRILIKEEKKNPTYYGPKSSFHKIAEYISQAIQGKLGDIG